MAIITVTAKAALVQDWVQALRMVRRELFEIAADHGKYARVDEAQRLLDAYSALAHLTAVLEEQLKS